MVEKKCQESEGCVYCYFMAHSDTLQNIPDLDIRIPNFMCNNSSYT